VTNLPPAQYAGSRTAANFPAYLSGYFDGEGCFTVSISPRAKLKVGWEVRPSASVSQNEDCSQVLHLVESYFGCGAIRSDPSDKTVKWEVRSLPLLLERVIPHFERWPMLSAKQRDFESFAAICGRMEYGSHLTSAGLAEIVEIAAGMNPSGKRRFDPLAMIGELTR
jgi:hypothetical protein